MKETVSVLAMVVLFLIIGIPAIIVLAIIAMLIKGGN